jgi:hypothetical protein
MGLQEYKVSYISGGTEYDLTNVQSINVSCGVQAQLDQIRASTGSVTLRYPSGFASPITALVPETEILIRNMSNPTVVNRMVYRGYITNVSVTYGIPYNASTQVGVSDYLTIDFEGEFARLARMNADDYPMAAGDLTTQFDDARTEAGVGMEWLGSSTRQGAATTISGTWGDWLSQTAITHNARLTEFHNPPSGPYPAGYTGVYLVSPFSVSTSLLRFYPVGTATVLNQGQIYDQITFHSLGDNYYTEVTVVPESFAEQTVVKSGASEPLRTYQVNTLNASTTQALDYANYLLSNYSEPVLGIASVSCLAEAQLVNRLDSGTQGDSYNPQLSKYMGLETEVIFRGQTFMCIIEGVTMSATPAGARFTFYLSSSELNEFLLLDNAFFGKLDTNKLAY